MRHDYNFIAMLDTHTEMGITVYAKIMAANIEAALVIAESLEDVTYSDWAGLAIIFVVSSEDAKRILMSEDTTLFAVTQKYGQTPDEIRADEGKLRPSSWDQPNPNQNNTPFS